MWEIIVLLLREACLLCSLLALFLIRSGQKPALVFQASSKHVEERSQTATPLQSLHACHSSQGYERRKVKARGRGVHNATVE